MKVSQKIASALFAGLGLSIIGLGASASELIYQPINPNFGGNPFNSQLLAQAQIQNQFDDADETDPFTSDPLSDFEDRIVSSLLSRISRDIADQIFDPNGPESGTFEVQDTTITFEQVGGNVNILVRDEVTGGETSIVVPLAATN